MHDDDLTRTLRAAANELDVNDTPPLEAIAAGRRSALRRRGILAGAVVVVLVVVGLAVTAAASGRSASERIHTIGNGTVPGHLDVAVGTSVVRIEPHDGASAVDITTQRDVAGVWALGNGYRADPSGPGTSTWEVWHFDAATGRTKSWSLGTVDGVSLPFGFSACRNRVWLGVNDELRRLDPATGKVSTFTLPQVPTVSGKTSPAAGVDSLACENDGSLLVAPHLGTSLVTFDSGTERFSEIPLPRRAFELGAGEDKAVYLYIGVTSDGSGHAAIRIDALPVGGSDQKPGASSVFTLDLSSGSIVDSGITTSAWPIGRKNGFAIPTAKGITTLSFGKDGTKTSTVDVWPAKALGSGPLVGLLPDGRAVLGDDQGQGIAVVDPADGHRVRRVTVPDELCLWSSQLPVTATAIMVTPGSSGSRGKPATTVAVPSTTEPHIVCQKPTTASPLESFTTSDTTLGLAVDDAGNVYYTRGLSPLVQQVGVPPAR